MSLVQESLIDVLNRRFVSCHYNAFPAFGYDEDAAALAEKINESGGSLQYGGILTPDGELVVSFGLDRDEFHQALKTSLEKHPEYAGMSDNEERIIRRANKRPSDVDAQFDAIALYAQILQFGEANRLLDGLLARTLSSGDAARARYLKGHFALIDLDNRDEETVRSEFANIKDVPEELADDIAMDLMELDVELTPVPGFFTGWRFEEGRDLAATRKELEKWIKRAPDSNRIGQMHFLLGLARMNDGDKKGADQVWSKHFNDYPEDRFALLSRIHHTDYQFSPYGQGVVVIQRTGDDPESAEMFKNMKKMGDGKSGIFGNIIIQGGENLDEETRKKLIAQLTKQFSEQHAKELQQKQDENSSGKSEEAEEDAGEKKKNEKDDDAP